MKKSSDKPKRKSIGTPLENVKIDFTVNHEEDYETRKEREKRERIQKQRMEICSRDASTMTQLNAIQSIVELLNLDGGFTDDFMEISDKFLEVITSKQNISKMQAVFMSVLTEQAAARNSYSIAEMANMFERTSTFVLQYIDEFTDLLKKHFIVKSGNGRYDYYVPAQVMDAICNDRQFVKKSMKVKSPAMALRKFEDEMVEVFDNAQMEYDLFTEEVNALIRENMDLDFFKDIYNLDLPEDSRNMFMHIIYTFIQESDRQHIKYALKVIDRDCRGNMYEDLVTGRNPLFWSKLIENTCIDGFKDRTAITLTKSAQKKFLKDFPKNPRKKKAEDTEQTFIIHHKDIKDKALFFPEGFDKRVDDLRALVTVENMEKIKKRMEAKKMRGGFNCLLYGGPGTGKTESVLQIAKATKRDVMQVNISEVKSMWVGESEKNIKKIFDDYREICKHSKNAPILLFNEADAIINKRMEGASHAVDKMENSIASICLNEMENLPSGGLVFATTNLTQSLDTAFERRFLYKLEYPSPDASVRKKIWTSMLPEIPDVIADKLSKDFQFSGGQIENAVRRYTVDEILYGTPDDMMKKLKDICETEKLNRGNAKKIGFY